MRISKKYQKVVYNNILPFGNFIAITLCGIIFVKSKYENEFDDVSHNHEMIHVTQEKELGVIRFWQLYLGEWIKNLFTIGFNYQAYYYISFEQEAYKNEDNLDYLKTREKNEWRKYRKQ